jgi:HD-GYP domain-containing protein (c-di-GMP phosphodiesterase class II)
MLAVEKHQLVAISPVTLLADSVVGIDIFASSGEDSEAILFCSKDAPVCRERLQKLAEDKTFKLYVSAECYNDYQVYLRENWDQITDNQDLSLNTRTTILNEVVRDVLNNAFRSGSTEQIVQATQSLSEGIVKILGDEKIVMKGLYNVLHHDYATFTHSTNVATYAVLLAKGLGYSAEDQNQIAVGALLHDLGKLSIDERILRKPGRLDEFEFKAIQKHPLVGFKELAFREDLSYAQLMMVYQHHEKLDGTGYPVGVVGDEIHPWAKLCAVVDIFEAITSIRPYRSMMEPSAALGILTKASGTELDSEMVRCWIAIVQGANGKP